MVWIICKWADGTEYAYKTDLCPDPVAEENRVGAEECFCVSDREFKERLKREREGLREYLRNLLMQ